MYKKNTVVFLMTLCLMSMSVFANETNDLTIEVNGQYFDTYDFDQDLDTPAVIIEGRTLLPLRKVFGIFEVEPIWNGDERAVTATHNGQTIKLIIDNNTAYVNGLEIELDVPAQIVNNRTYVPLRFITETFGIDPQWDGVNRIIRLENSEPQEEVEPEPIVLQ